MRAIFVLGALAAAMICSAPMAANARTVGHVTGIGGVVVVSKNPRALAAWYRDVLGMSLEPWAVRCSARTHRGTRRTPCGAPFRTGRKSFAHGRRDFMLNLAVDDLDAMCRRLRAKGVPVYERQSTPYGKFASVVDPDGTKVELWEASKR